MNIQQLKSALQHFQNMNVTPQFVFEDTLQNPQINVVPLHFHITEMGISSKHFIDCGGTIRTTHALNLQLWVDYQDLEHRLSAEKFLKIVEKMENIWEKQNFSIQDMHIEVEYQPYNTISKFQLDFLGSFGKNASNENHQKSFFVLKNIPTACLAQCTPNPAKTKVDLATLGQSKSKCC